MAAMTTICAIGTAAADIKARMSHPALDTTDVPGRITLTPGGVSRNIAENLARLGAPVVFIGVFGDDAQARSVIEASRAAGMDVRPIVRAGYATAALAVMLDADARQIAGVFSGDILDTLTPLDLAADHDLIRNADALLTDGGVPQPVLAYLADTVRPDALFYCNPASAALAARLPAILHRCDLVTCNHLEAEALTGVAIQSDAGAWQAAHQLIGRGVRRAVITLGSRGLVYADATRQAHRLALPTRVIDATGAGDALAAALIFAHLRGDSIDTALSLGLAAAALTCQAETSVSPAMSLDVLSALSSTHL